MMAETRNPSYESTSKGLGKGHAGSPTASQQKGVCVGKLKAEGLDMGRSDRRDKGIKEGERRVATEVASHSSFATRAHVNLFPLRVDVDKADNANLVISRSGLLDKGKKEGVGSARGNRHDTLLSAIQQRSCIPSSQKNPKRRPSTSVTTYAKAAAFTTPRGPSFGLTVESASHDDSTEIAWDDKVSRNTTLVVDSREGEGCRRLKENSERLQALPSSQDFPKRRELTTVGAAAKVEGLPSSQDNSKRRESTSANAVTEVAALATPPLEHSFGLTVEIAEDERPTRNTSQGDSVEPNLIGENVGTMLRSSLHA
ncbi:hypothetical protein TrCOL_g7561, partial [Triparma columacea]